MAKITDIGQMDTLVTLQSCVIGKGTQGQQTYTWSTFRKVWAKVERNTSEMVDDYNLEQRSAFYLTIHKVPTLTSRWRVLIAGKTYEVTGIEDDDRLSPLMTISVQSIDGATNA